MTAVIKTPYGMLTAASETEWIVTAGEVERSFDEVGTAVLHLSELSNDEAEKALVEEYEIEYLTPLDAILRGRNTSSQLWIIQRLPRQLAVLE